MKTLYSGSDMIDPDDQRKSTEGESFPNYGSISAVAQKW